MSVADIVERVRELGVRHVVVTGGEPLLFEPVQDLALSLAELGHVLTFETAGTVFRDVVCDLMSISPKLSNSTPEEDSGPDALEGASGSPMPGATGPSRAGSPAAPNGLVARGWRARHEGARSNLEPLRRLLEAHTYQLKFVVNPDGPGDDLAEIHALVERLGGVPSERVMLMAEGTDAATLSRRERLLAPICVEHGYRLSPRLHVHWFGNTRGT